MADLWDLAPRADRPASIWDLAPVVGGTPPSARQAQDIGDAIMAGLQSSATGLALRRKLPDKELGEDAPWYHRAASGVASVAADTPLSIVGALVGAPVGAAVSGPAAPLGAIVGGGAGAFAVPMALRDALIEAYNGNHASSWEGVADIAMAALKGGTKGAFIGALTGTAGAVASRAVGAAVAPGVGTAMSVKAAERTIGAVGVGTELATLTTASAALEGKMPTWQDFMDNAILLGGMKGAAYVAKGMRNVFAETGREPAQVVVDAKRDPAIKAALEQGQQPEAYSGLALEQRIQAAVDKDPRPEFIRQALTAPDDPAKPVRAPVAWEYVTDSETAKGVLREVTARYGPEIEAQRRGIVTNAQSVADARALLDAGAVGKHKIGDAGNSAEILVRAALVRDAARHATEELAKISRVPEAELTPAMKLQALAAIERVSMLNAEFAGARAEAGRALQIFRAVKRDPTMLGEANMILAAAERKGAIQDIAKLALMLKDNPDALARFANDYVKATTLEKVLEGWKAGILSGPQTHLANIFGNLTKYAIEVPESTIAATLYAVNRAAHGEPIKFAQWKARALSPLYGIQFGAADALKIAGEVWRGQGADLEKADVYRTAIEGKKGEVIRIPFKALQVEDAFFRTFAERAEAYKMAVDRAVAEALHPDTAEFRRAVVSYTAQPTTGLSEAAAAAAMKRIQEAGAEAVFSQRLGPFMETMQGAMAKHVPALQFVLPFVRTPANLVSWAVQHVPGLNILSNRWRSDFAAGGELRARAIARVMVGAGMTATALALTSDGVLTGGGMFDKEQGNAKRAAGWQPYSIKVGDTYYSYQRIEPVAKVLGLAADLIELGHTAEKEEDFAKIAALTVLLFGNATISTTYLSGLSNVIQAATDPARRGEPLLEQYASSVVPKIVGQTVALADPHKREVDGVLDAIQSQLPFLREKMLPKRDVWGEPTANARWFAVMPVATSEASHDKVRTEAQRLSLAIADVSEFVTEKGPLNLKDRRSKLTPEQRDVAREVTGKTAMSILSPIVNAPDWERIPDFAKAEIYKKVLEGARKQGQLAALPPDDAARVQLRQKLVDEVIRQTQAVESK